MPQPKSLPLLGWYLGNNYIYRPKPKKKEARSGVKSANPIRREKKKMEKKRKEEEEVGRRRRGRLWEKTQAMPRPPRRWVLEFFFFFFTLAAKAETQSLSLFIRSSSSFCFSYSLSPNWVWSGLIFFWFLMVNFKIIIVCGWAFFKCESK